MTIKMTGTPDEIAEKLRSLTEHPLAGIAVDLADYEEDYDRKEEYYD